MHEEDCENEKNRYISLLRDLLNDRIARSGEESEAAFKTE